MVYHISHIFAIQILCMYCLLVVIVPEKVDVKWIMTTPAVFGKQVYLNCSITGADCNGPIKQWIGGPTYKPLCQGNRCIPNTKYNIMSSDDCTYILAINDFWENDGNCDYTCGYGVTHDRKRLSITENAFQYVPDTKDVDTSVTLINGKIYASVFMKMVYPLPYCSISINGIYHPLESTKSITATDIVYNNTQHGELAMVHCPATITVMCTVGNHEMELYSKVFLCEEGAEDSTKSNFIVLLALAVISVILLLMIVMIHIWRKRHRRHNNGEQIQPTLLVPISDERPSNDDQLTYIQENKQTFL